MHLEDVLARLEALGTETLRLRNRQQGAGDNQFGVQKGDLRKLAKELKSNHGLALELWATGNIDAQLLAILLLKPKQLSVAELETMLRAATFAQVADWLNAYVVANYPQKEALRTQWMDSADPWIARAGWGITSERINKAPEGLDLAGLLDRIEAELAVVAPEIQWPMNMCLAGIGIHNPDLRARAIAIGEALGVYRDFPVSRGCTSPFAPIWIAAMAARQA